MVGRFRRTLSFPNKPAAGRQSPPAPAKPSISHHTRSISLPCRSHPLISHLTHGVFQLRSWSSGAAGSPRTATWLSDGICLLKDVHDSLSDILELPQSQTSLRNLNPPAFFENLLEDFLRFVDVYGIFQTNLMSLREQHSAAQVALRKKDESAINSYARSRAKISRDIARLATSIRRRVETTRDRRVFSGASFADAELASAVIDVVSVTVSVSVELFHGVCLGLTSNDDKTASFLDSVLNRGKVRKDQKTEEGIEELKQVGMKSLKGLRKKKDGEIRDLGKKMREFENCVLEIENGTEKVFRCLISTRVSLLNALTN